MLCSQESTDRRTDLPAHQGSQKGIRRQGTVGLTNQNKCSGDFNRDIAEYRHAE
jgi:hypothetical protein